ncbi:recombinase family protein [Neobacillus mesonae]|uniref:recombinase family protein n=1 Tax=Neobacillus mesonae TaxID=1193713 RepID=UPI002573FD62|nr:recombinase family protein [Neobacillus mesonae]
MSKTKSTSYRRYSDKKQDDNHSLEIQKSQILLLADRENLEIVEWRTDKATSAFHNNASKREGIQLILEDIENGAEAVCFYEESRITRSITDFYNDVYLPVKEQYPFVKFYSTQYDGEWNPNDPLVQAKLVFAAEESEIKSIRAKDAQASLIGKNKRPGSREPLGYNMVDGLLYPNGDAPIVELIFYLASLGHSQDVIAEYLNNCKIITKNIKSWSSSTIGYVLSNRVYSGQLAWDVRTSYEISKPKPDTEIEILKQPYKPIVSRTLVHLVNQISELKAQYGTMSTPYYLRGIIKCKECHSLLQAKDNSPKGKKGQYMAYRCTKCKKSVSIIPIHEAVLNDLQRKWLTQLTTFTTSAKEQLKNCSSKLYKTKEKLKKLLEKSIYNERMLSSDIATNNLLAEAFTVSQKHLQDEIAYINATQEEIKRLLDDDFLAVFMKEMIQKSFYDFADTELRVFFLMYFDEVIIDFEKNNDIQISYRLSPFVSLEATTGQLTEKISKRENLTG